MKVKSESEVAQSCPTLSGPMDCSPPGSSVYGISQARVVEWGAIAFSDKDTTVCKFHKTGTTIGGGHTRLKNHIIINLDHILLGIEVYK